MPLKAAGGQHKPLRSQVFSPSVAPTPDPWGCQQETPSAAFSVWLLHTGRTEFGIARSNVTYVVLLLVAHKV